MTCWSSNYLFSSAAAARELRFRVRRLRSRAGRRDHLQKQGFHRRAPRQQRKSRGSCGKHERRLPSQLPPAPFREKLIDILFRRPAVAVDVRRQHVLLHTFRGAECDVGIPLIDAAKRVVTLEGRPADGAGLNACQLRDHAGSISALPPTRYAWRGQSAAFIACRSATHAQPAPNDAKQKLRSRSMLRA